VWWRSVVELGTRVRGEEAVFPIDLHRLGSRHDIEVREDEITALGITVGANEIRVRSSLPSGLKRLTIAHEMGHLLVKRSYCPWLSLSDEERFCDAFARELLAPVAAIQATPAADIEAAAMRFGVTQEAILLQLAALGIVEPLVSAGSGRILCIACGDRKRLVSCACALARGGSTGALPHYPLSA
jgi:hypothetical protein